MNMSASRIHELAPRALKVAAMVAGCALLLWLASLTHPFTPVVGCLRRDAWAHDPILFWTMQAADAGILLAYLWIPIEALDIRRKLKIPFDVAFVGLAAFVLLCGNGHGLDILTAWIPLYWLSADNRVLTAVVSLGFAAAVRWHFKPGLLRLPSFGDMVRAKEIAEAERAKAEALAAELAMALDELGKAKAHSDDVAHAAIEGEAVANQERLAAEEHARRLEEVVRENEAQRAAIKALGVIVLPALKHPYPTTLLVPVQGPVDTVRIAELQAGIAEAVAKHGAKLVIVDFAGVPIADTSVVQCMLELQTMLQLLGARCAITGLRAPVAQTMTQLIRSGDQRAPELTLQSLADGLELALSARSVRRAA